MYHVCVPTLKSVCHMCVAPLSPAAVLLLHGLLPVLYRFPPDTLKPLPLQLHRTAPRPQDDASSSSSSPALAGKKRWRSTACFLWAMVKISYPPLPGFHR